MRNVFIGLFIFWIAAFITGIYILPQYNTQIGGILVGSFIGLIIYFIVGYIKAKVKGK